MKRISLLAAALLTGLLLAGCTAPGNRVTFPELVENATPLPDGQPSHITVQHVLIGFQGSVQGKDITRTRQEARQLARDVLRRARSGENFAKLVEEFTDDSAPGIYHLANHGQPSDMTASEVTRQVFPRDGMVPAFGDVGFPLAVGEVGMSDYDTRRSPYGWHIVKRLR